MKQTDKSENKRGKLVNRLLVLAQIFFVLGLATVALTTVSFVRNRNQKRNEFNRSLEAVQIQLQSDLENAGFGLAGRGSQDAKIPVVRELSSGAARPMVYPSQDGKALTIIQTAGLSRGEYIKGNTPSTFMVIGIELSEWINLPPGTLCLGVSQGTVPVLIELKKAPRKAVSDDAPPKELGIFNLDRAVVCEAEITQGSLGFASLGNVLKSFTDIIPIQQIIRYQFQNGELLRLETKGTSDFQAKTTTHSILPATTVDGEFSYQTNSGQKTFPRENPADFKGIHVTFAATSQFSSVTETVNFDAEIGGWVQ